MKSNRLGLAMALVGGFTYAQTGPAAAGPASVRATGEGVVYAKPDQARIDIAVATTAATAQAAGAQNASQAQAMLDQLRKLLGVKADIRTVSYSLTPNYQYPRNGGKATIDGYNAVNTVEVVSDDLSGIGKVIDTATAGGANRIQRLQFELKDPKRARAEALRQAAEEARANAESMAGALGLKLGRVLALDQTSSEPAPVRRMLTAAAMGPPVTTPVEAEPVEVRASVTLTAEIEAQRAK